MNTKLKTEAKNNFKKDFKLTNNAFFEKSLENIRKHRNIKLVRTNTKRNKLLSEPNYHTTKWLSEDLLAIELKRKKKQKLISQYIQVYKYQKLVKH